MAYSNNRIFFSLAIVIPIVLIQAIWIFSDARAHNEKYYWLWGLFGLLNVPSSLIIYLLITRSIMKRDK